MRKILICQLLIVTVLGTLLLLNPAIASDSSGVDFFTKPANGSTTSPTAEPLNIPTTAAFTVDLGVPNKQGSEDAAPNVTQQTYTVTAGNNGLVEGVTANSQTYTPAQPVKSYSFTIPGGNTTATFMVSAAVEYTAASATDNDKAITLSGVATFSDGSTLSTSPNGTVTSTAVTLTQLSCGAPATQSNVNQNVTIGGRVYGVNYAAVKSVSPTITFYATLQPNSDNAAQAITWSGGKAVPGHSRQMTVDGTISAVTAMTITCGSQSLTSNLWVIWSSYEIRLSGTADPGQVCQEQSNLTVFGPPVGAGKWRLQYGGGTGCGPIDSDSNQNLTYAFAVGRTQGICTLTPSGIGKIIANTSWNMTRHKIDIGWDNAGHYTNIGSANQSWAAGPSANENADDQSNTYSLDLDPGPSDKLYDVDAPGCPLLSAMVGNVQHTSESYINFTASATVQLDGSQPV